MNLEELKSEWAGLSLQLETTQRLQMTVLKSVLNEKSHSRIQRLKSRTLFFIVVFLLELLAIGSVFLGNPFDFIYTWQYVPFIFMALAVAAALSKMISRYQALRKSYNDEPVEAYLKRIITYYEKNHQAEKWLRYSFLVIGLSMPMALISPNLFEINSGKFIKSFGLFTAITLLLYFVVSKVGLFKNMIVNDLELDMKILHEIEKN